MGQQNERNNWAEILKQRPDLAQRIKNRTNIAIIAVMNGTPYSLDLEPAISELKKLKHG